MTMKVIAKTLGVIIEILLIVIMVLLLPLCFAFALHDRIRYGTPIPNIFSELLDVIKSIFGNISKIISL